MAQPRYPLSGLPGRQTCPLWTVVAVEAEEEALLEVVGKAELSSGLTGTLT